MQLYEAYGQRPSSRGGTRITFIVGPDCWVRFDTTIGAAMEVAYGPYWLLRLMQLLAYEVAPFEKWNTDRIYGVANCMLNGALSV